MQPHLHFLETDQEWESAEDFLGGDGLCGIVLPVPASTQLITPHEHERVAELAALIKQLAPVHYIATGPCTNLAELCRFLGDDLQKYITTISIMGGALKVAGNSGHKDVHSGRQYAEFNFYCDPFAVDEVLRCGVPVYVVSWDTTQRLTIPLSRAQILCARDDAASFVRDLMLQFFERFGLKNGREFEFNDPAAVWLPRSAPQEFQEKRLAIVLAPDEFGKLIEVSHGHPVSFHSCEDLRIPEILDELLAALQLV